MSAPGCLNSLQKLQLVSCGFATLEKTPYTAFSHFYTSVRLCFWVPFWSKFHFFLQFSGAKSALLSQPKAKLLPSVPRTGFLEPCSCFLRHFSQSFPGSAEHKCSKPRKTPKKRKIRVFSRKCYLFCRKALRRVSLHLQQNITDLHQRFPVEKGAFSEFSPTMSHLSDASGHRGCIFTTLFLHIQTR